jgi:PmbA protein
MIDVCEYAVKAGEKQGADEIEAVWVRETSTAVEAELSQISKTLSVTNEALRIRVIADKALSSIVTYRLDEESIKKAVTHVLSAARASKKDEQWISLPSPGDYPHVDAWDPCMQSVSSDDLTDPVMALIESLPQHIEVHLAANEAYSTERAHANSQGISHLDRGTVHAFGMAVVGKSGGQVTPTFSELKYGRRYDPHPEQVSETVINLVNSFTPLATASSGRSRVIFSPDALSILFTRTLFKTLSGEYAARGRSQLAGKEGEIVAHEQFSLHDTGIIETGTSSREMDDEGTPCQDTALIVGGVLKGFIWNDYWAKRAGKTSTGNAFYNDRTDEMFIRQTNMAISPGDCSREELLDIKDGYLVLDIHGAHSSNPESGDFSIVCSPAYRIENGEISGGVTGMMLSDNVFSLIKNIDLIGKDTEIDESTILPYIRFNDVMVIAQ